MGVNIEHQGIIESISPQKLSVRFTSLSACAGCHAKGYCSAAEMQEKQIEVADFSGDYRIGESVNIVLQSSQGFDALLIGYVYPFLLVLLCLVLLTISRAGELQAGLLSLGVLVPYYLFIYYRRKRISHKFQFKLRKLNQDE